MHARMYPCVRSNLPVLRRYRRGIAAKQEKKNVFFVIFLVLKVAFLLFIIRMILNNKTKQQAITNQ
jgi:hypothetical protein